MTESNLTMRESQILETYTSIFQVMIHAERHNHIKSSWMDEIVVANFLSLSADLDASTIGFLGRQVCRSVGLCPRHNLEPRKIFPKLLLKFHPDKVKNLFGNLKLHQYNFRAWYVANLIGKFCIQMLKLSKGENAT